MFTEQCTGLSLKQLLIADAALVPLHVNPHAATAEALVEAFARNSGLYLPGLHLVNTMTAFLYPTTTLERLTIIGKMMFLLFYVDDVYGDLTSAQGLEVPDADVENLIRACCTTFASGQAGQLDDPLIAGFLHVRKDMNRYAEPGWLARFSQALTDHLMCSVIPFHYGWDARMPSVETYIYIREHISGMYPTIDFVEFASGQFLAPELYQHPFIQRMRLNCAQIACLTNDLFSYHKEILVNGLLLNLIQVIQSTEGYAFKEAAEQAIDLINERTQDFFEGAKNPGQIPGWTEAEAGDYIRGLASQISATWHWQLRTNRYRSPESPFVELQTLLA